MKTTAMIISIIVAFGYPTYNDWVTQARRADAKNYLNHIAALQEKFKNNCSTYSTNVAGGTINDCTGLGYRATSPDGHYTLTSNPVAGSFVQPALTLSQAYRVNITPVAGGLQVGNGMLGIDSTSGRRWDRDNSGGYGASETTWGK